MNFRGDLIRELIARGYVVHASAPDIDQRTRDTLDAMGAKSHSLSLDRSGLNPASDLRYFREMIKLMRAVRPDLVINYTIKPNIWGSLAARWLGIPACSMVTGIGYLILEGEGIKRRVVQGLAKRLYTIALSQNRVVIFQNNDDVDAFVNAGLVDRKKVRTVRGSGVNLDRFHPVELPKEPIFLMIARLLRTKGIREYAAAAAVVKRQYPQARFLLVGGPDAGPDGIAADEVADLSGQGIEYLGPKQDVRPSIAEASVFVLPSYREGTPRSVLEAMAMARAVITTDAPGCRETVEDGANGFLVPVGEVRPLQDAMTRLIENEEMRSAMGQASLARARDLFDVEKVNQELLRHFELAR